MEPQRNLPVPSPTSLNSTAQTGLANGGDWQEVAYQKIKTMKELYFLELNEMHMIVTGKLNQRESLPQQPGTDQLGKLKQSQVMLERLMSYLQVSKSTVTISLKDKIGSIEKQIISFLNSNRPRKPVSSIQQGQLPPPNMPSLQQSQQAQVAASAPNQTTISALSSQPANANGEAPIASNDTSEPAIVNGDVCTSLAASIQALGNEMNANFAMLDGSVARLQKDVDSLRALLPGRGDDSM